MANKNYKRKISAPTINQDSVLPKAPEQTSQNLIVNKMVLLAPDRTPKDVGTWRDSHRAAESVYYPNRSRLYDLYLDVELDAHLSGIKQKRIDTVLNKKIRFVGADGKEVEDLCKLIKTTEFRRICHELLNSIFWGISGFEFIPGQPFQYKEIPRKHIKPEKKVIAVNQTDYDGVSYDGVENIWVVGEDRDLGLFLKCAFYVLLKKGNFSDWATYIEIFGQPLIVTRYDTFDEKTKIQLTKAMEDIGSSMRLSIPKQASIEVLDGKTSNGNGDLQDKFKNACNEELSVVVLGNTETTSSSKSSGYAQSKEHGRQQSEISKSDMQLLLNWLNSDHFKKILESFGFKDIGEFIVEEMMDPEQQLVRAQSLQILKTMGLPLDDDQLYEEFGLKKPDNYAEQKTKDEAEEEEENNPNPQEPPPMGEQNPTKAAKKEVAKANDKKQTANLSFFDTLRSTLADFFDPAHKG